MGCGYFSGLLATPRSNQATKGLRHCRQSRQATIRDQHAHQVPNVTGDAGTFQNFEHAFALKRSIETRISDEAAHIRIIAAKRE
jgi:hypothetical protein